jgi:hypothetical protein
MSTSSASSQMWTHAEQRSRILYTYKRKCYILRSKLLYHDNTSLETRIEKHHSRFINCKKHVETWQHVKRYTPRQNMPYRGTCNLQKREQTIIRNFIIPTNTFMKTLLIGTYPPIKNHPVKYLNILRYLQPLDIWIDIYNRWLEYSQ